MRPLLLAALVVAMGCGRASTTAPAATVAPGQETAAAAAAPNDDHAGHGHAGDAEPTHAAPAAPTLCAHGVPAELCTRCDPELVAVFQAQGDWCAEHGLPESHCKACNPGLTFAAATAAPSDWCAEHALPESMCTKCDPKLVARFIAAGDYCREHGFPESVCPRCHPDRALAAGGTPPRFPPDGTRVRLASLEVVASAGIETRRAEARAVARTLEVVGHLDYDRNRLAQLASPGDALVLEVRVDVGDDVKKGQPLAVLSSAGVGGQRAALATARARRDAARAAASREEALAARGVSARRDAEEARRELAAAEAEHDAAQAALSATGARAGDGGRHVLVAPFDGTVVARDAVAGRTAPAGHVLLELADLSRMWAQLDVPEADAARVRPGQPVTLTFDAIPGLRRETTIARVGSAIDPASRTLHARAELQNPDRSLKAGLLVRAELRLSDPHAAVLVPREAVQHAEGQPLVFVRASPVAFRPVPVRLGEATGDAVAVAGISAGDEVVTTGAFLLKTEILKDSIGAGCCESERPK